MPQITKIGQTKHLPSVNFLIGQESRQTGSLAMAVQQWWQMHRMLKGYKRGRQLYLASRSSRGRFLRKTEISSEPWEDKWE